MNPYALWAPAPQAGASANFATPAQDGLYEYSKGAVAAGKTASESCPSVRPSLARWGANGAKFGPPESLPGLLPGRFGGFGRPGLGPLGLCFLSLGHLGSLGLGVL